MIVAGVVIQTAPGAAPRVAARLLRERGLELHGGDGDRRLAAVFTGADAEALERLAERLVSADVEVLGVFPTFVADEPDDDRPRDSATRALAPTAPDEPRDAPGDAPLPRGDAPGGGAGEGNGTP